MDLSADKDSPAPGTYEIVSPIGYSKPPAVPIHPILVKEDQENKTVGFNAQAERFSENKNSSIPGPGTYKIIENKKNNTVIVSKDSRFKKAKDFTPGPGAYSGFEGSLTQLVELTDFEVIFFSDQRGVIL